MKTQPPLVLALCLAGLLAQAAPPPALTVAVYDFKGDGEAAGYGNAITALVTSGLTTESNLVMLERADLDKALKEQAFGVSGLVSADAAAKIGAITGAKVLVAGQIIKSGSQLIIVADIIGTETGRLFAEKVQGAADDLGDLTMTLSGKIARTISAQATNLMAAPATSSNDSLERVIKSLTGMNRPSVSINIFHSTTGAHGHSVTTETELGRDLLKAGFPVVDDASDRKPDLEITGVEDMRAGFRNGALYSFRCNVELKVQDRRTGNILTLEHQESSASASNRSSADHAAQVQAAEQLAEKILPLLAK